MLGLCIGDREARANGQCGELIDRTALRPARQSSSSSSSRRSGHTRLPFAGYRRITRAGVKLAAIDAHRAAEAATDLERRLDDGVAREARLDWFEIRDFAGRAAAGHSVLLVRSRVCARSSILGGRGRSRPLLAVYIERGTSTL
jgi:hypothetical protein